MPNNKGGKKYKRNKNVIQENKNTRFKDENESQEYAQITSALGNCRFDVLCFDGKSRLATMCGKMRKRVFVNQGELILVSLRDWQDSKCDIIDKYNQMLLSYLTAKPHWLAGLDRLCCDIYQGLNRLIIVNRFSSPNYIS